MNDDLKVLERQTAYSSEERRCQVLWLKNLSLIEERGLFALAGYESLWLYVRDGLGYSEGSVGKRLQVSRTARKFPKIYELLEQRKISMSAVSRLTPELTPENQESLLEKASGKSVRKVEELVAELSPKPDVKESTRAVSQATLEITPMPDKPKPKQTSKPLSAQRYHVNFTVDKETNEGQRKLAALTRHLAKPVTMEDVYRAGVEALLQKHDPDLRLQRKRAGKPQNPNSRYVSRETQRVVRSHDGSRCAHVSPDGRRCEATTNLQYDHIKPWALGGKTEPENLRLLCATHNRFRARQTFGTVSGAPTTCGIGG